MGGGAVGQLPPTTCKRGEGGQWDSYPQQHARWGGGGAVTPKNMQERGGGAVGQLPPTTCKRGGGGGGGQWGSYPQQHAREGGG